jgi:hemoglobin
MSEVVIGQLVHTVYASVRRDWILTWIIEAEIHAWGGRLGKLCAFCSWVALMTGRYKDNPVPSHVKLAGISAHSKVWPELFAWFAPEHWPPQTGRLFIERSDRNGQSLQLAMAMHRGMRPEAYHDAC